ncbi:MAG: biotin transporter BioY [Stomatobaculum sp.]
MKTGNIRVMTMIAVMTAVMCIFGPMSVPIGPVPISLTVLTVYLAVYILGMKCGTLAYLVYLLIGFAGVPVLSGYSGGPGKVLGPTGGYLLGFIFMALISGWFIDHFYKNIGLQLLGMLAGLAVCYAIGTLWLAKLTGMSFSQALAAGVIPFIAFDVVKIAVAVLLGRSVRSRLGAFAEQR